MCDFIRFEFNKHKTFQDKVVKYQVDIKFRRFCLYYLLTGYKGKTFPQFKKEFHETSFMFDLSGAVQ